MNQILKKFLGPVVQKPISTNLRLNFNLGFFFFYSKAFRDNFLCSYQSLYWRQRIKMKFLQEIEKYSIFSGQKPCTRILLHSFDIFQGLWILVICNNTKDYFSWEPEKINVKFHKNCKNTVVRCDFVTFDIYFLRLSQEIFFGVITDNWLHL